MFIYNKDDNNSKEAVQQVEQPLIFFNYFKSFIL